MRAGRRHDRYPWALACLLAAAFLGGSSTLAVEVTRGPYLQMGGDDRITIRWRTDIATGSRVDYGTPANGLNLTMQSLVMTTDHVVELVGLEHSQRYDYAVGSPAEILAGDDGNHYFITSPLPGQSRRTRMWILGDSGEGSTEAAEVRDAYYAYTGTTHTDLWLMLGDNAYPNGTDQEYQDKLFDWFPQMLRKSVLWPTLGNHDAASADSPTESGVYYDVFTLPRMAEVGGLASGTEAYYSFDFGSIHFIVLDSQDTYRKDDGGMMGWLEADLAATAQDWIVAFWHHPPYSRGSHNSDVLLNMIDMRQFAVPILDDYGVDLTFTGHSHSYERSYPTDGHYGDSETFNEMTMRLDGGDGDVNGTGAYTKPMIGPNPHSGIVHTVAGSSSKLSGGDLDHPVMLRGMNEFGSVVIDIDGPRMDAVFLSKDGVKLDEFTIVKGPVPASPVAAFSAHPVVGQFPLSVTFSDATQNEPTSWEWDGDGDAIVDSIQPSPTMVFDQPGIFDVSLTASNVSGSDQLTETQYICVVSGIPQPIENLRFTTETAMTWDPLPDSMNYQLVRGELGALKMSDGNFAAAGVSCSAEELPGPSTDALGQPPSGAAWFYLVRAKNCALQQGSWDSPGAPPQGTRDPDFEVAAGVCGCSLAMDDDGDAICDGEDACPFDAANDGGDFDSICGDVDNCPTTVNPLQANTDGDATGDLCDPCPFDALDDDDGDGLCADVDNCPTTSNSPQVNQDGDLLGDACDACPLDPFNDADSDAVCGDMDNCPVDTNGGQENTDGDAFGNVCDPCPVNIENDADGDTVCEDTDNCLVTNNPAQRDDDLDGIGNVCDICFADSDTQQLDADSDGVGDECDCFPNRDDRANPVAVVLNAERLGTHDVRLVWGVAPAADRWTVSRNTTGIAFSDYGACFEANLAVPQADDTELPPSGDVFFYQVRSWNDVCGEGSLGFTSQELPRKNLNAQACTAP
ncbi:MAG: metallophosphoesterase [Acidobacteriota bacterium]|nr:metallophosphoesterase [Acidobacteriota bacterium]